jgi:hypothetical protein
MARRANRRGPTRCGFRDSQAFRGGRLPRPWACTNSGALLFQASPRAELAASLRLFLPGRLFALGEAFRPSRYDPLRRPPPPFPAAGARQRGRAALHIGRPASGSPGRRRIREMSLRGKAFAGWRRPGHRTSGAGPRARPDSRPANQGLTRSPGSEARSPRQANGSRLRRVRERTAGHRLRADARAHVLAPPPDCAPFAPSCRRGSCASSRARCGRGLSGSATGAGSSECSTWRDARLRSLPRRPARRSSTSGSGPRRARVQQAIAALAAALEEDGAAEVSSARLEKRRGPRPS